MMSLDESFDIRFGGRLTINNLLNCVFVLAVRVDCEIESWMKHELRLYDWLT